MSRMTGAFTSVDVHRVRGADRRAAADCVATEEPLEVRLRGERYAVIMRTPGADRELVAGFLLTERVLDPPDDLGTIEHCRADEGGEAANVVNVTFTGQSAERVASALAEPRRVTTNASCGLCGRQTIDAITRGLRPVTSTARIASETLVDLPARLAARQAVFSKTGGLHAAALFDVEGTLHRAAEDVGRHNAVDKVIGAALMADELPLDCRVLFVSGRTSFEIVQKAFVAGLPIVASVSAPSSLAVQLAAEAGITLVGFVRNGGFNVYAHHERVAT